MLAAIPHWTTWTPIVALLSVALPAHGAWLILIAPLLVASVLSAVHQAEIVAHRVGEPFGTFILAIAVTVLEVGMIVTLMLADPEATQTLARDTVFAAAMIIMNLLLGLCLLTGGIRHHKQRFKVSGPIGTLATLAVLTVTTLILPSQTISEPGPVYSDAQLAFAALVSLLLYLTFVFVQTVSHRADFVGGPVDDHAWDQGGILPSGRAAFYAFILLVISLIAVILLAKGLSGTIDDLVINASLPTAVVGIIIALIVLMPEGISAVRAARADRLQTSLNLTLGSAAATIGLTIPVVAAVALYIDMPLALGLDATGMTLLAVTLFVAALSLTNGRTTLLQGAIHLVLFAVYLFITIIP